MIQIVAYGNTMEKFLEERLPQRVGNGHVLFMLEDFLIGKQHSSLNGRGNITVENRKHMACVEN
jgi:hypothetical protein